VNILLADNMNSNLFQIRYYLIFCIIRSIRNRYTNLCNYRVYWNCYINQLLLN